MNQTQKEKEKNKLKETYVTTGAAIGVGWSIYFVLHFVAFIFAVYLSFKCNQGEFHIWQFLAAFFCPWIYLIYVFAKHGSGFCLNESKTNVVSD